jgi:hypothetical protein
LERRVIDRLWFGRIESDPRDSRHRSNSYLAGVFVHRGVSKAAEHLAMVGGDDDSVTVNDPRLGGRK